MNHDYLIFNVLCIDVIEIVNAHEDKSEQKKLFF